MAYSDVRQKVFRIPGSIVLSIGLSWDFVGAEPVDLDLSAVCFTKEGRFIDVVFFNRLFPAGTDGAALRAHYLVDPDLLPYMFLGGDSTIGGEEENQLPGLALAARRRQARRRRAVKADHGGLGIRDYTGAAANIFNRLYEEEQLADVQLAVDEADGYDVDLDGEQEEEGSESDEGPNRRRRRGVLHRRELPDEVVTFVMDKIPAEADAIFLTVSSYTGQDFTILSRAQLVLYNESTNERVGVIDLKHSTENGTANLAAMLVRVPTSEEGSIPREGEMSSGVLHPALPEWDLRELNVRSFGYTFVDVLPLALDVLGVRGGHKMDVLKNLPDYSLSKVQAERAAWTLSDVRFGVGWSGEHDIDAFLVLLDEDNNYVDHLYPKNAKLRSMARDLAQHSGDALCGSNTAGDEEFVDLLTYRVPPNVTTIVMGATWMESFGPARHRCTSIADVPDLYLRLQNRTVMNPYSMELDRWQLYREAHNPVPQNSIQYHHHQEQKGHTQLPATYKDTTKKPPLQQQPVRTVVLGALVKTGTQPFDALFPNRRRIDQHFLKRTHNGGGEQAGAPSANGGRALSRGTSVTSRGGVSEFEGGRHDEVPVFQFLPIHQYAPVDPREGFARVIPYLQCMVTYVTTVERETLTQGRRRCVAEAAQRETEDNVLSTAIEMEEAEAMVVGGGVNDGRNSTINASDARYTLSRENNLVGWNPTTSRSVGKSAREGQTLMAAQERAEDAAAAQVALRDRYHDLWTAMAAYDHRTDLYAIAVQFLEVTKIEPQMPDRFRCHGEAWVFGQTNPIVSAQQHVSVYDNTPFRTSSLVDRTKLVWADTDDTSNSCGHFLVRKYDRLRVVLFETASIGIVDLDLMTMDGLWEGKDKRHGSLSDRFNPVECTVVLDLGDGCAHDLEDGKAPEDSGVARPLRYSGELRMRVSRVPLNAALRKLQRQADRANTRRDRTKTQEQHREAGRQNDSLSSCATM